MSSELFKTDEFKRYHRKLVTMIAKHVWGLMVQNNFEEAKGALQLAYKTISFPTKLSSGDDTKQMIEEVMRKFKADFIRDNME